MTAEEAKVREAILSFVGDYDQIPPMYSALKVNGQKLCDLARAGKEVERKPRRVTIREIRIEKIDLPRVTMEVTCSKGTYIRTLCQDIGENLGCGGCMESLLRTRVERFSLEDAIKLGEVEAIKAEKGLDGLMEKILPIDGMFPDALKAVVPEEGMKALVNGNSLKENQIRPERAAADNERVRVYDEAGRFYALYRYEAAEKQYRLEKMFYDREEEQDGIHTGAGRITWWSVLFFPRWPIWSRRSSSAVFWRKSSMPGRSLWERISTLAMREKATPTF